MAKPRVFISSTYFDLKSVRADLEHFVREQGFDPVLHERGSVPYGSAEALERYCYKEIETCDILISIVGGRFGSKSNESLYSVSQTELRVALEQAKQVYIYVDREVYHEYRTYEKNKDEKIKWASVDNARIYEFLSEVYSLKNNNPIQPFETSYDITANLKEQWAGLFQRLLTQQSMGSQTSIFHDLKQSLEAARSLVDVIASQTDRKDDVVSSIILVNHPFFAALRKELNVPYRFIIETRSELDKWMGARGFTEDPLADTDTELEWYKHDSASGTVETVKIRKDIFDEEGRLKSFTAHEWPESAVSRQVRKVRKEPTFDTDLDDDVPF